MLAAGCGQPLFESEDKFDSGSGWPIFTRPAETGVVDQIGDASHGMVRTEVVSSRCQGHLGHVFPLRHCVDSATLDFKPEDN